MKQPYPRGFRLTSFGTVAAAMALLLGTGCDPLSRAEGIGVIGGGGATGLTILFSPCANETVRDVRLVEAHGNVLGDDDPVLWEVTRTSGTGSNVFVPGVTPPGYREIVALTRHPDVNESLGVLVNTSIDQVPIGFRLRELSSSRVLVGNGDSRPIEGFTSGAAGGC